MSSKSAKKPLKTSQIVVLIAMSALFLIALMLAAYIILYEPDSGKRPTDTLPFETNWDTADPPETRGEDDPSPEDKSYNFLVVGHDRAASLADVIMLINYNVTQQSVAITQIPRDTYVETEFALNQINVAFSGFYNNAAYAGDKSPALTALGKLAALLEKNLCIQIHFYAAMDLDGFVNIVDLLGGVEMNVPTDLDYDDPEQDLYIHIKAGQQVLDGKQAEGFVRFRDGFLQADIGRGNAQKMFMAAFLRTAKSKVNLTNVTSIMTEVLSNLQTNITLSDAVYFAKNILGVDLSRIVMLTISGSGYYDGYILNRKDAIATVNRFYNIYDFAVTDSIFDSGKVFYNEDDPGMCELYFADNGQISFEYIAGDLIDNPIDIPRR